MNEEPMTSSASVVSARYRPSPLAGRLEGLSAMPLLGSELSYCHTPSYPFVICLRSNTVRSRAKSEARWLSSDPLVPADSSAQLPVRDAYQPKLSEGSSCVRREFAKRDARHR